MKTNKSSKSSNKEGRYISYFQSVLTIGIMTRAKNHEEAEKKATIKMKDKNGVNYCVFEQTDFELSDTEEFKPEIERDLTQDGIGFKLNLDENTRNIIATRLSKNIEDVTDTDVEDFVKQSIETALNRNCIKEVERTSGHMDHE